MSRGRRSALARLEGEHWWFRGRRKVYLSHLRAAMGSVRVPRALDVGGAEGGFARALTDFAEQVVEVDVAHGDDGRDAPRGAERGAREGAYVTARMEALPFGDRRFDLVTLFDALGTADDEARALAEARRVLRPGGLLVVSLPANDGFFAYGRSGVRSTTRARLRRALESADLNVERVTHASVLLLPLLAPTLALFRLLAALRIVPTSARHTNLAVRTPKWLAPLLYRAFTSELSFTGRFDLPFGHSIVALARRPIPSRTKRVKRRLVQPSESIDAIPSALPTPTPSPSSGSAADNSPRAPLSSPNVEPR